MHPRIARLFGVGAVLTLAAGCGDPPLATLDDVPSLAQGPEPRAPSSLSATAPLASQVTLSWQDNSPNETGFELYRSLQQSESYTLVVTTAANAESYTDKGRTGGSTYCYKVRAFKRSGSKSTYSSFAGPTCATTPVPPAAAFEATAVPTTSSSIRIGWKELSSDEHGFRVQRGPGETGPWTTVATTGPNTTKVEDIVATDLQVCYQVVAFNGYGEAPPSNIDCSAAPAPPANLRAEVVDEHTIRLAWDPHPADPPAVNDGIQVQRYDPFFGWSEIAVLPAHATTYEDAGLVSELYWYVVRATKDGGYSSYSNFLQVLLAPPAAPSNLAAYPFSSSSAVVYWNDNSGSEDWFELQRAPSALGPWTTIAETWADYPYFEDYGLVTEEQVCYRAIAVNSKGPSDPSEPDCTAAPAAPTGFTATTVDHQSINVSWDAHPDSKDGYTTRDGYWLYRSDPWSGYLLIAELGADATSYSDTGLESQAEYRYLLLALNDGDPLYGSRGYSDWSNEAIATTDPAPGTTANVTAVRPGSNAAAVPVPATRALMEALKSRLAQRPVSPAPRTPPAPR